MRTQSAHRQTQHRVCRRGRLQQALTATPNPSRTWLTLSEFKGKPRCVLLFLWAHPGKSLVWALLKRKRRPLLHLEGADSRPAPRLLNVTLALLPTPSAWSGEPQLLRHTRTQLSHGLVISGPDRSPWNSPSPSWQGLLSELLALAGSTFPPGSA